MIPNFLSNTDYQNRISHFMATSIPFMFNYLKHKVILIINLLIFILFVIWLLDPTLWNLLLEHFKYPKKSEPTTEILNNFPVPTTPSINVAESPDNSSNFKKNFIIIGVTFAVIAISLLAFYKFGTKVPVNLNVADNAPLAETVGTVQNTNMWVASDN